MKLLVDTHAVLWWLSADARLTPAARQAIARAGAGAAVSAASIWEASIKRAAGKLTGPDLVDAVSAAGFFSSASTSATPSSPGSCRSFIATRSTG